MNKVMRLFQFLGVFLLLASCSPFKVVADYDKNSDFSQYKTYALKLDNLGLNDIDESRVVSELQRQLALKNIHPADNADMIVEIKASHKLVKNNYVTPSIHFGSWGRWFGGGLGVGRTISSQYNQGTLVFNIIDAKTEKMVWQGTGSGIKVDSPSSKDEQIPKIIAEILKNFPPKQK